MQVHEAKIELLTVFEADHWIRNPLQPVDLEAAYHLRQFFDIAYCTVQPIQIWSSRLNIDYLEAKPRQTVCIYH